MGCDIHSYVEQYDGERWVFERWVSISRDDWPEEGPFRWRTYAVFGFLADVRNYSGVTPIAEPRGLPGDASAEVLAEYEELRYGVHSASWLLVEELSLFPYDGELEDRRVTRQLASGVWSGAVTADPGQGRMTTYREFLGPSYFKDLALLEHMNRDRPTRVVFWFDN